MDKELEELTRIYAEKHQRAYELSIKKREAEAFLNEASVSASKAAYEAKEAGHKLLQHLHHGKQIAESF